MAKLDTCYAIVDSASEPKLFSMLEKFNPPSCNLYSEPISPEVAELAPYLIEVTDEVQKWLSEQKTPWGIYVYTKITMRELRQHLRKYLMVMIPEQEKPVFWRFYDPRNIWFVLNILDNWKLHVFLGPINKIGTELLGRYKESDFKSQRSYYPDNIKKHGKLMSFTKDEYEKINLNFECLFIKKMQFLFLKIRYSQENSISDFDLSKCIVTIFETPILDFDKIENYYSKKYIDDAFCFSEGLVLFCKNIGISDQYSYMLLCYILGFYRIYDFENLPINWINQLNHPEGTCDYRIIKLCMNILDEMPVF
ncbi:DUF4123 domain-containing protein [Proteus mirabilis]|nr:DUF4123 domain-containing protein [Proteus mirabilis]